MSRVPPPPLPLDLLVQDFFPAVDAPFAGCTPALTSPGPVTALTSDPDDLTALCGGRIAVIKV
ncbi:hypothetical protein [Streptomyces sp. NBC_01233]|uniref:hypothetical protein n=1 Tax=Streptomyces sp. NBC_01233 TaxID=2903787 RepID=UPI003FA39962